MYKILSLKNVLSYIITNNRKYNKLNSLTKFNSPPTTSLIKNNSFSLSDANKRFLSKNVYDTFFSLEAPHINAAYSLLNYVHANIGLPWWLSIIVTTSLVRTFITLPLFVLAARNSVKIELLQPEIKDLSKNLSKEIAYMKNLHKWDIDFSTHQYRVNMKRLVTNLYTRDNCHPAKAYILPWIQIPIWISMSIALRNISGSIVVEGKDIPILCWDMSTQGLFWFNDLLKPDIIYLPIILCVTNLLIIEMHNLQVSNPSKYQRILTNSMRIFTLILYPIACTVPSCMSFYWTCSSVYGLLQNLVTRSPRIRRRLKIPLTPRESATPFSDLFNSFLNKLKRNK